MIATVVLSNSDILTIGVPVVGITVVWATWITKMVYDIRTDTSSRAAQQDAFNADIRADISELQDLLPRHIPNL